LRRFFSVALVLKADWLESQNCFTRFVDRLDIVLEPRRRSGRSQLAVCISAGRRFEPDCRLSYNSMFAGARRPTPKGEASKFEIFVLSLLQTSAPINQSPDKNEPERPADDL
jgi:hypothetical protein